MHDPELQGLQRSVHLVEYARGVGYQPNARESGGGMTMLENPHTGDRVAVARTREGQWIYASLKDHPPRGADETLERAHERLRESIARTRDKGSIVEFVQHCERSAARPAPTTEQAREHLRAWTEKVRTRVGEARLSIETGGSEPRARQRLNQRIGDWTPSAVQPSVGHTEVQTPAWPEGAAPSTSNSRTQRS